MNFLLVTSNSRRLIGWMMLLALAMTALGCHDHPSIPASIAAPGTAMVAVDLSTPAHIEATGDSVALSAARNSWSQFALQLDCAQLPVAPVLRLPRLAGISLSIFQVLPAPVDLNDAGCVRQSGEPGGMQRVPRVLLPMTATDGSVDLRNARDPLNPRNLLPRSGSILLWIDLQIPEQAAAGNLGGDCELTGTDGKSISRVPVRLTVENLTLPTQPHLAFAAPLNWTRLAALHPGEFEAVTPRLLNRGDSRHAALTRLLDRYIQLAHDNKTSLFIPRLQPIVKWPLGKKPEADWSDFDSVVAPWLTGSAFADRVPAGFWPLPAPDSLVNFDLSSQLQYWQVAADHFDQLQWLDRAPLALANESTGPVTEADSILQCAEARLILSAHPRINVLLGLQQDQIPQMSASNPRTISPASTSRLLTAAPGLVCSSPIRDWPPQVLPPRHWVDATAADGPLDITGLASEDGIRTLAWLAFSRDAALVLCGNPLPSQTDPAEPAPGNQLIWCYPGEWYGSDQPLATIQLKWLRQAEQDYEYLCLAGQNQTRDDALRMCRLITKPVQLQPAQKDQPLFSLLAGGSDPRASEEARQLLVERLTRQPDAATKPIDTDPLALQTLRWFTARQRPTLVATGVKWLWNLDPNASNASAPGTWIDAKLDVDLYNPADDMATGSSLQWTVAGGGWEIHPQPIDVPALAQYQVTPLTTSARFDLGKISPDSRQPLQLTFIDGFTGQTVPCKLVLPVATSERRQQPLTLDGSLGDWFPADAVQLDQPLVRMLNRPALQSQEIQFSDTASSIYTSWSDENFYIAFRLGGVATADLRSTRNFVQYNHGRAWGEDLCELLIQPIYIDNTVGPTLHVVCKPGGNWVEQQQRPADPWQPFEACGIRYAATIDAPQQIWRGEVAIPWKAIAAANHGRPGLLRFNFIQHQQSTAQSASWAGPIDQSRDGKMAGLLLLKEP